MSDAERIRIYLRGWDDSERCLLAMLASIPEEHRAHVARERHQAQQAKEATGE